MINSYFWGLVQGPFSTKNQMIKLVHPILQLWSIQFFHSWFIVFKVGPFFLKSTTRFLVWAWRHPLKSTALGHRCAPAAAATSSPVSAGHPLPGLRSYLQPMVVYISINVYNTLHNITCTHTQINKYMYIYIYICIYIYMWYNIIWYNIMKYSII